MRVHCYLTSVAGDNNDGRRGDFAQRPHKIVGCVKYNIADRNNGERATRVNANKVIAPVNQRLFRLSRRPLPPRRVPRLIANSRESAPRVDPTRRSRAKRGGKKRKKRQSRVAPRSRIRDNCLIAFVPPAQLARNPPPPPATELGALLPPRKLRYTSASRISGARNIAFGLRALGVCSASAAPRVRRVKGEAGGEWEEVEDEVDEECSGCTLA